MENESRYALNKGIKEGFMKAVLYARVSSKEQEETGYSLQAQEKLLKEYAALKGFWVEKVFSVSESANGQKQREIFIEMLAYVREKSIKIIVCEKVDRLTRNFKDAVLIDEWMKEEPEREIHLVKENSVITRDSKSHEKFMLHIKVSVAEYYANNLSEEVKKGQKEKIAQGWKPTKPPLGYKTIGESGHKIHVIDEEKALFVRRMFELYATGQHSLEALTQIMYQEGFRSHKGHKVAMSRIADMLDDPFYVGKFLWNGELYEGKHEPLVTKETFNRVQRIKKLKNVPKHNRRYYTYHGLIKCGECSRSIIATTSKGHIYYYCTRYETNCTQKKYTHAEDIESQIIGLFEGLEIKSPRLVEWIRDVLKDSQEDEIAYREAAIKKLNQQHEQLRQILDRIYDDKLFGRIDKAMYERKCKQYMEEAESVLESIKAHQQADNKYHELGIKLYELSQQAREIFCKASDEEKRVLVSLVFEEITLKDNNLTVKYSYPFEVLREAVKATNGSKVPYFADSKEITLEPSKKPFATGKNAAFASLPPALLGG